MTPFQYSMYMQIYSKLKSLVKSVSLYWMWSTVLCRYSYKVRDGKEVNQIFEKSNQNRKLCTESVQYLSICTLYIFGYVEFLIGPMSGTIITTLRRNIFDIPDF